MKQTSSPTLRCQNSLELLEVRIAPAAILTLMDVDGDNVTIKTSKGTNAALDAAVTRTDVGGGHFRIDAIDLSHDPLMFAMTDVSVTAKRANGGDGLVDVGRINSLRPTQNDWIPLGKVTVGGNLGEIDAGSTLFGKIPGLKSLSAQALGPVGFTLGNTGGDGESDITGSASSIKITGDLNGALRVSGDLRSIVIGGDLQGGSAGAKGLLFVFGKLKNATIGAVVGGTLHSSGSVTVEGGVGKLTILHDVTGGSGEDSGSLRFINFDSLSGIPIPVNVASLTIGGNLSSFGVAGQGVASGTILSTGSVGQLSIAGDVAGDHLALNPAGTGVIFSAQVDVLETINALKVGGKLRAVASSVGGKILVEQFTAPKHDSIGTALIGGFDVGGGLAAPGIKSLVVSGDITGSAATPDVIQVIRGLQSLVVKGDVAFAKITAGLDIGGLINSGTTTPDAQIGNVTVNGSWTASSLSAGVRDVNNDGFGNADDAVVGGFDSASVTATIKSITIGKTVDGTATAGDHFGFTAQLIGKMKVNGVHVALTPGAFNDGTGVDFGADVTAREVAAY